MYLNAFLIEIKKIIRDKMMIIIAVYPIILGFLGKWLLSNPDMLSSGGQEVDIAVQLLTIIFSIMGAYMFGVILGFSILEDREDKVFQSVKVSPISTGFYIWIRVLFVAVLGFLGNIFVVTMVTDLSITQNLLVSFTSALQIPIMGFFINLIAKNKVEGFVAMKGSGFIFMIPIIGAFFFTDWKEFLFSISPGFWPAKATQVTILENLGLTSNLPFLGYILIGVIYEFILAYILYYFFKKKESI